MTRNNACAPWVYREALVTRPGLQFAIGERIQICTRAGSDEEALSVIAESLVDASPAEFQLGPQVEFDGRVLTIVAARDRALALGALRLLGERS